MVIIKEKGPGRHKNDYYPTPIEYCRASIEKALPEDFSPAFICDAGAGTGLWGKALREYPKFSNSYLVGVDQFLADKVDGYDSWYNSDYLTHTMPFGKYDLIIGNPPYSLIEEFIWHSFEILNSKGYILFLMRQSMLEGQKRHKGLWKEHPVKDVWVSTRRISFSGDGKSDDTSYATFLWREGYKKDYFIGHWLDWSYDVKDN